MLVEPQQGLRRALGHLVEHQRDRLLNQPVRIPPQPVASLHEADRRADDEFADLGAARTLLPDRSARYRPPGTSRSVVANPAVTGKGAAPLAPPPRRPCRDRPRQPFARTRHGVLPGAMCAAEHSVVRLMTLPDDAGAAMAAGQRHCMNAHSKESKTCTAPPPLANLRGWWYSFPQFFATRHDFLTPDTRKADPRRTRQVRAGQIQRRFGTVWRRSSRVVFA
jgi:hypothetical protein